MPRRSRREIGSSVENTPLWRRRLALALLCIAVVTCFSATRIAVLLHDIFSDNDALVTPWGVQYFIDNPSDYLQAHEQCHLDRLEEIGPIAYYSDYILGGACEEEIRCNANPRVHPACTKYPLSRVPELPLLTPVDITTSAWWLSIYDSVLDVTTASDTPVSEPLPSPSQSPLTNRR